MLARSVSRDDIGQLCAVSSGAHGIFDPVSAMWHNSAIFHLALRAMILIYSMKYITGRAAPALYYNIALVRWGLPVRLYMPSVADEPLGPLRFERSWNVAFFRVKMGFQLLPFFWKK